MKGSAMAFLTPMTHAEAVALGARFGLTVVSSRALAAGSVNSSFALGLDDGSSVFLRVFEEQQAAAAAGEARLLDHLASRGVPTPRPLARVDGVGFIAEHLGKPVAIFPWVPGDSLCQALVTPAVTRSVGDALGRVHAAGASFVDPPPSRFGAAQLAARLDRVRQASLSPELSATVERLAVHVAACAKRDPSALPGGLVHGDLFRDNVLWSDGTISALLDFESASRESYSFDLMVTVLAWCCADKLEPALCRALFAGYLSGRGLAALPREEDAVLFDEAVFAALRFTVTRITDFELRPRGSGVFKDYRRFLARLDALEAMGPAGLRALLVGP